jgi:hypothetical protein
LVSGQAHGLAPSVDRVDNDGDYEFGNIQIITVSANSSKGSRPITTKLTELS